MAEDDEENPEENPEATPHVPTAPNDEAPLLRAQEMWRRILGASADSITLGGVNWATAIAFARTADTDDGVDGWTPIGPRNVGGAVRALAQDPVNTDTFYAGTAGGGLYRTTDDGHTWEPLGEADIGIVPIGAVAVAPTDRNVIYVGTGEPLRRDSPGVGLFRSIDGGTSFQQMAPPGTGPNGASDHYRRIVVDPQNARRCWVASDRGLWRFDEMVATQELAATNSVSDLALAVDPANAGRLILLAGVAGVGVRRGVWTRAGNTTAWTAAPVPLLRASGAAAPAFGRVKVAFAPSNANIAYAMCANAAGGAVGGRPQRLYRSTNAGVSFRNQNNTAQWPADSTPGQAFYSMALAVHPTQPACVVAGHVNLYVSTNGGRSWVVVNAATTGGFIDWQNYSTLSTVGEHGDIHAIHFDLRDLASNTPRIWVGNDGGISTTNQWVAPGLSLVPGLAAPAGPTPAGVTFGWRKRSYGIQGGQAVDISSHPQFPSLTGAGFQDNASFFSWGGPTWHLVGEGDGAATVWHPTNPQLAHISWQFAPAQLQIGLIGPVFTAVNLPVFTTSTPLAEVAPPNNVLVAAKTNDLVVVNPPFGGNTTGTGVFRTQIIGDGSTPNRLVVAAQQNAWLTILGTSGNFNALLPAGQTFVAGAEVSAMCFVPGSASNRDIYVGNSVGDIFAPTAAGNWRQTTPFTASPATATPWVACIAVHPVRTNVVAACAFQANPPLLLSHDAGATWVNASGGAKPLPPNTPVTSLAWHPTDETVLYAGTMVGVWVARDLPAFTGPPPVGFSANPTWKTFNRGMGPLLVNDLEVVPFTNMLRCATYSRGCFEASLRGKVAGSYATGADYQVPPVRLSIRDHAMDDSRPYPGPRQPTAAGDPRLPGGPTAHLSGTQSIDIKVNAPEPRDRTAYLQSERFNHRPDGAELDEQFVCENPFSADMNIVYIQVHNRGWQKAENVQVFLYFADAGSTGVAPTLTGLGFPGVPPGSSPWKRVPPVTGTVMPGNPNAFRFEWTCPVEIKQNVALLAICRSPDDELAPLPSGA
ncbi:MAG TPA: hypothetical protein VFB81_02110, partial [Myxococcales bacterium]|nr:hypothetical protein [Myxococcales bacterium]